MQKMMKASTKAVVYYGVMEGLLEGVAGDWMGMSSITVNRQSRAKQPIRIEFFRNCQMGQACGRYRWEDGCLGDLVLIEMRRETLYYQSVPGASLFLDCPIKSHYVIKIKPGDKLSLSISYKDEDGHPIARSVTLERR